MSKKSAFVQPGDSSQSESVRPALIPAGKYVPEEVKLARKQRRKKRMIFSGVALLLVGALTFAYLYWVSPPVKSYDAEATPAYALSQWNEAVNSGSTEAEIADGSFLAKEKDYGNGNEDHSVFVDAALASVQYDIPMETMLTIWGNPALDSEGNERRVLANFNPAEQEVGLQYVDWSSVQITEGELASAKEEIEYDENTLVPEQDNLDLFLRILANKVRSGEELPLKSVSRLVYLGQDASGAWVPTQDEDITLDQELFSSEDLEDLESRFEDMLVRPGEDGSSEVSEEWLAWDKLEGEEKENTPEPEKLPKYARLPFGWIGAYNLQVVQSESGPILPQMGEGTKESPAGINTPVATNIFIKNDKGEEEPYPVKVELKSFLEGQEALDYFEGKDIRNRGLTTDSRMKLFAYSLEVTNLGDKEVTVPDLTILADYNANSTGRTGVIYGLQDSLTLKPGESGLLETWGGTITPESAYLLWGKDFNRRVDPVWFRVLAAQDGEVTAPAPMEEGQSGAPQSEG